MHNGSYNMRDEATDWYEMEECLYWIEEINPTLREYERWLELNETVEQDLDVTI